MKLFLILFWFIYKFKEKGRSLSSFPNASSLSSRAPNKKKNHCSLTHSLTPTHHNTTAEPIPSPKSSSHSHCTIHWIWLRPKQNPFSSLLLRVGWSKWECPVSHDPRNRGPRPPTRRRHRVLLFPRLQRPFTLLFFLLLHFHLRRRHSHYPKRHPHSPKRRLHQCPPTIPFSNYVQVRRLDLRTLLPLRTPLPPPPPVRPPRAAAFLRRNPPISLLSPLHRHFLHRRLDSPIEIRQHLGSRHQALQVFCCSNPRQWRRFSRK